MDKKFTDKIKLAREMFRVLEDKGGGQVAEIARRNFCIQDRLATINA